MMEARLYVVSESYQVSTHMLDTIMDHVFFWAYQERLANAPWGLR